MSDTIVKFRTLPGVRRGPNIDVSVRHDGIGSDTGKPAFKMNFVKGLEQFEVLLSAKDMRSLARAMRHVWEAAK